MTLVMESLYSYHMDSFFLKSDIMYEFSHAQAY